MKVALLYLGCRVNQAEIGRMEQQLLSMGHHVVELEEAPDYCIVNTCTVTKKSDDQSRQLVRKATKSGARVLVTGCYAQMKPEELRIIKGVEAVIENSKKHYIINEFIGNSSDLALNLSQKSAQKSKFFLKVQDGCDNSCTYCTIWMAREKSRSVPFDEVLSQAREAEMAGYNEIDLTGIHLGMYGGDIEGFKGGVAALLEGVLGVTNKARVRLSSLEVNEIDSYLLDLMKDSRICDHLHVPLQSGDDDVLRDMGRKYTVSEYSEIINTIHDRLGPIGIGADLIAGFPSETHDAHDNTMKLLGKLPLTYMHVFPYSNRPGTVASSIEPLADPDEIRGRASELRVLADSRKSHYLSSQMGKSLEVLVEKVGDSYIQGTSSNYLKVRISVSSSDMVSRGTLARVEIQAVEGNVLMGKLI